MLVQLDNIASDTFKEKELKVFPPSLSTHSFV